jgi:antitoxin (DNA-binding transcriptional repressor) of toxin-antitoxin stability system
MNWAVQDAKARFSELLRAAEKGPQVITYRGEPAYEVRRIDKKAKEKKPLTLADVLELCPRVPEFELPKRQHQPPRKIFEDDED